MSVKKNHFFREKEVEQIVEAIKKAELNTSGEIKVHVEKKCRGNAFERAIHLFNLLELDKTKLRNGVLFYLATRDKKFVILGDKGINEKVADDFWEEVKELVISAFKDEEFADGLASGILMAGEKLKEFFPYQDDDINELSDDISYGED